MKYGKYARLDALAKLASGACKISQKSIALSLAGLLLISTTVYADIPVPPRPSDAERRDIPYVGNMPPSTIPPLPPLPNGPGGQISGSGPLLVAPLPKCAGSNYRNTPTDTAFRLPDGATETLSALPDGKLHRIVFDCGGAISEDVTFILTPAPGTLSVTDNRYLALYALFAVVALIAFLKKTKK